MSTRTRTIRLELTHREYYALRTAANLFQPLTRSGREAQDRALDALERAWTGELLLGSEDSADIICKARGCWLTGIREDREVRDPRETR